MHTIEPCYKKFGELIYQARMKLGLTTNEAVKLFAKEGLIMQRTSLTHMELGNQRVMLHALPAIAKVLKLDIEELLTIFLTNKRTQ